ncbi:glucose/quinate/shikimate family membrane-bound PQQ-dependent dehydrogenase [Vibrio sp. S17_S38]|uniref:glucose/quinate/shikimate family membrane-bound PQQ-dependent dehydrogenase n=1 Tax=Vibrio sp. S17_S38 TaxID=2720229 RepID=UPI001681190F|nr:glucose/quinate/shikimate family membrane-bound PQQ-dependent dehydrogenase [Vibrio sp. S17_S38]MBD1573067.1 glucose/quinate/shikimate family membrane-bound PQQ-dependent dehydrogenase [Vibrio sp. S17_S38]
MKFFSVIFMLLGLVLAAGGAWLMTLGGNWYYLFAGIGFFATGLCIWQTKRTVSHYIYTVFLLVTTAWAFSETGFDWWPLSTRMGLPLLLAIPLLVTYKQASRVSTVSLLVVWGLSAIATLGSIFNLTHDIAGNLPTEVVSATPDMGGIKDDAWTSYGRSNYGQRYSPLDQITPKNVGQLTQAWQIETGDQKGPNDIGETTYQATPIKLGNTLYLCTPHNWLVALNADTGEKRWVFDAKVPPESQRQHQTCRGVSFLPAQSETAAEQTKQDAAEVITAKANAHTESLPSTTCDAQLFLPTSDARLIALDPKTGARCSNFAKDGVLDLMQNMPYKQAGYYYSTSPPIVTNGVVVVSGAVNDNYDINSPSGVIRAYDAKTGELKWNWDSANPDDTSPIADGKTYTVSSPNSWSVASADAKLGLIYFPMGNRTPDQLGMYRNKNEEKYSSSVVALDVKTGQAKWVQQFVHHDLWDMDTPAQPSLVDITTKDGVQPGLVVPTKQGDVYVLNRATGEPLLPITEEPAPKGAMKGDFSAETQPVSALSFNPPKLKETDMWGGTLIDQMICRIQFKKLRYDGRYTPPSEQGTIVYPGNFGVFNWGGVAVDPKRQIMFGMPLNLAFVSTVMPKSPNDKPNAEYNKGEHGVNANNGAPYAVELKPFLSPIGVPCQQPPWGYVAGANLATGKIAWQHKNGTVEDMTPLPLPFKMGVPGIGGPIMTGGGVAFLAASVDNYIRAYDVTSGDVLWKSRLPAGGQATPMTYLNSKGEQMVVLVAGGHGSIGTKTGDFVMAYKLEK